MKSARYDWVLLDADGTLFDFGATWNGWAAQVIDELAARGILIRSHTYRGVAEEAPGAYKDVSAVVDSAEQAGLARKVARLAPVICIKG